MKALSAQGEVGRGLHLDEDVGRGQHAAHFHYGGCGGLARKEQLAHAAVLWEVVQVLEVLHQLEYVGHLAAGGLDGLADAVEHIPALREDGALLDVAAELARAANQRGGLMRDVVVACLLYTSPSPRDS